jgi:endothelin-converting enzyme
MREIYAKVLTRLLTTFQEEELLSSEWVLVNQDGEKAQERLMANVVEKEETVKVWPPWPWPPWDGDNGDNGKKHMTDPAKLAEEIVAFERKLANATLDLSVALLIHFKPLLTRLLVTS